MTSDYLLEDRLNHDNPDMHLIFKGVVVVAQKILENYKNIFPNFTDHSNLHSMNVLDFANKILGTENIQKLNTDEVFIFLLSVYLHDTGLGISADDFLEFFPKIAPTLSFSMRDRKEIETLTRKYHHELSGAFINKYAALFDIPDETYQHAIVQVVRGHREVDLLDETEYPVEYRLANGNTVCLPYLGALIRLADEIDVSRNRNDAGMYIIKSDYTENDKIAFSCHYAISSLDITPDEFILNIDTTDDDVLMHISEETAKMQATLDFCRQTVNGRTRFTISQKKVTWRKLKNV